MISKNLIAILFLITLFSCGTTKNSTNTTDEYFNIKISQDGKIVKEKNGIVELSKKPFKIHVDLVKTDHVYVSSSWGKYYYDYPIEQNIFECNDKSFFKDCRFVAIKTGNEDKFNVNKDIYVGDGSYQNVWFYEEDTEWHRFDKDIKVENGITYATVTVENIYDMDKRDERKYPESEYNYPIEKINSDIYFVFATDHYEKGMEHPKELQRKKILLKFK
ncbi:hypothetical protein IMCC3317_08640 [Kordia antarctica]|uniref:Lipoprotein n=1 Tax=Kordia antarctica TaxID=1218801 RepID=A0A7L4ZFM8_9FLAO|nr:hypothetical protein [Kordia antarctica]QHI35518.1 hypothetical protein IMCC3317_08640 [Kordia antarctica]